MKRIVRMLIHIILIAVVLFLVYRYSDGWILVESSKYDEIITFVVLSSFLYAINISVKKIVSILTLPIKWLTLGLFAIVLNVLFLYVFEYLVNNTVDV